MQHRLTDFIGGAALALAALASAPATATIITKAVTGTLGCFANCGVAAGTYLNGVTYTGTYSYDDAIVPTSGDPTTFRDYSGALSANLNIGSGLYTVTLAGAGIEILRHHNNANEDDVYQFGAAPVFGGTGIYAAAAPNSPASLIRYVDATATNVLSSTLIADWPQTVAAWSTGFAGVQFFITDTNTQSLVEFRGPFATIVDAVVTGADLSITKTDNVTTATPGTTVTYTITAGNAGPDPVTGASVTDTLPAFLTGGTWTCTGANGGVCAGSGNGSITDTVDLPAGGSVTYTLSAMVAPNATGTLTNTASIAAPMGTNDPNTGNNATSDTDTLTPSADLAVTKSGPMTAAAGGTATYTVVVTNGGPSTAAGVTLTDAIPAGMSFNGYGGATDWGVCATGASGPINCNGASLAPGASFTLVYTLAILPNVANATVLTNTATASAATTDPNGSNNSATASTTVQVIADLAITKTDGVTTATPGGSVTYTITATNAGPSSVTGATVVDTLPAALTGSWICSGAGGGTCAMSGTGNITDTVNLPAGGSVTYTVNATINAAATGPLSNTATITAPAGANDPTPGNNSATDTDTLVAQADVGVTLTDAPDPQTAGSNVTYTITATNGGPSTASNVVVSFPLPANATFVSAAVPGANCTTPAAGQGGTVTCTASAPLAPAGTLTGTIVVNVNPAFSGTLTATATIASTSTDPNSSNDSATTTTAINPLLLIVSGSASGLGAIACNTPVQFGQVTTCALSPAPGNLVSSVSGCGGTLSGNIFTTGPITAACTVTAVFAPTSIPALSDLGLAALALLLAMGAALGIARRR